MLTRRWSSRTPKSGCRLLNQAFVVAQTRTMYRSSALSAVRLVTTTSITMNCTDRYPKPFRAFTGNCAVRSCYPCSCTCATRHCSSETTTDLSVCSGNADSTSSTRSETDIAGADEASEKSQMDAPNISSMAAAASMVANGAQGEKLANVVRRHSSINSVTLVGVAHDIQTGYVYEDVVTQFTLTTTSLDTTNPTEECVVEKDHHTIRCFGDVFAQDVRARVKEGNVICVNGRLRLNPQIEPSCGKYYYFPYIQVQPPHGQVAVVYGDRRAPPSAATCKKAENVVEDDK